MAPRNYLPEIDTFEGRKHAPRTSTGARILRRGVHAGSLRAPQPRERERRPAAAQENKSKKYSGKKDHMVHDVIPTCTMHAV